MIRKNHPWPRTPESYSEIYIEAGQTGQDIPEFVADYTLVTNWSANGETKRSVADGANDKITIYKPGWYSVAGSFSFFSTTDSIVVWGTPFLDGTIQGKIQFKETLTTKTNVHNTGFTGIIAVSTVPVDLDFRIKHATAATVSITFKYANLNIHFIGGV